MASPTMIVAYLALFTLIGLAFLGVNLLVGRFLRPNNPHKEKLEIYECGEPTIGSAFVQFDLRFYVVALVFLVFDAEVAFLFPTATVFGKQTQLVDADFPIVAANADGAAVYTAGGRNLMRELGVYNPQLPTRVNAAGEPVAVTDAATANQLLKQQAQSFTWYLFWAINLFFVILLIGFAYEWKTGAFDWVRALSREIKARPSSRAGPLAAAARETELAGQP